MAGTASFTVLVVDDDQDFRDLARAILEPAGFRVVEAEGVSQGLSQLQSHAVDAIVLDIVMPGRDGFEAVRDIKRMSPRTKVITVSGAQDSEEYLATSAYLGADASLGKNKIASLCALLNVVLDVRPVLEARPNLEAKS
jgi:two-component system, OmpR family, response regulator